MTHTAPLTGPSTWGQPPSYAPQYGGAPVPGTPLPRRGSAAGIAAGVTGALAVLVSFTSLNWFSEGTVHLAGDRSGSFGLVQDVLVQIPLATGFQVEPQPIALAYFSYLGWGLLVVVALLAALANVPATAVPVVRAGCAVVALGAATLTVAAINLISVSERFTGPAAPSFSQYLSKAGPGFYTAVAGFLLLALAGGCGARRRR